MASCTTGRQLTSRNADGYASYAHGIEELGYLRALGNTEFGQAAGRLCIGPKADDYILPVGADDERTVHLKPRI
jgi:hypothetical protein